MGISNKIKFFNQDKTTQQVTTATDWIIQGNLVDQNRLLASHNYLMVSWVNCTSPGTNRGATKLSFTDGGGDIPGSDQERHDTNSSGMNMPFIGQFTCPATGPEAIGIYRKRLYGSEAEETDYGQAFLIDLSYSGASGSMVSGTDFSSLTDLTETTRSTNATVLDHGVTNESGTQLVFATLRAYDSVDTVLVGLYINDALVASGSRYVQSATDIKSVVFAGAYNMASGDTVRIKNLDANALTSDYKYACTINIDNSPATKHTGQLTTWTNHSDSGSWGTTTIDGNDQNSFVVAMGRQTSLGAESGRMAAITLKNNTSDKYLNFESRPSGNFNALYFPATNPGINTGQYETSVIVGVGDIGQSDQIEVQTL